jgi:tetratricopeptide (TPR) repeat protein
MVGLRCAGPTLLVLVLLAGCNGESAGVKQARDLLPLGKAQEALDKLGSDKTPEAHYLRAVSLMRLNLRDAAADELQKALEQKPDDKKYLGFQLRLQLEANAATGGAEEVDRIIQLHEADKASPALALFATTAYARRGNAKSALEAFRTAVALSDAIPEMFPEMLAYSLHAKLPTEAKTILDKLDKLGPGDKLLAKQRVATLILLKQNEEAVRLAKSIYAEEQSQDAALFYANALSRSDANADRDQILLQLRHRFAGNRDLLTLYCGYLVRSGRLDQAVIEIDGEISRTPDKSEKYALAQLAIGFPLEAGQPDIAEAQVKKYQTALGDPLLVEFYDGRIAHARRDYATATTKLGHVLQAGNADPRVAMLSQQAAMWLEIVQGDQRMSDHLKTAAEGAKKSAAKVDEKK